MSGFPHPVEVEAADMDEAINKAISLHEFRVYDEDRHDHLSAFVWDCDEDSIEKIET